MEENGGERDTLSFISVRTLRRTSEANLILLIYEAY